MFGTLKRIAVGLIAIAGCASLVAAQDYPSRPITVVVPFAAGGPTDVVARIIANEMSQSLGQTVVVENRGGASSIIGATYVASAANDGYTLLFGTTSAYATNSHVFKNNIGYDPRKFSPIAMVVKVPLAFAVRKEFAATSLKEFADQVKASSGGRLQFGSAGAGSHSGLACFLAGQKLGLEMQEIPYKGTGPALTDLMAGRVDALCDSVGTISAPHKAGNVKIIGELDSERSPALPDVPTFVESGFPDLVINNWFALTGPEGVAPEIVEKLSASVKAALEKKIVADRLIQLGFVPDHRAPNALGAFMQQEYQRFEVVVEQAGIKIK
jgi:tripartite-type tricarboxylate transporter receptor subunit TctC